MGSQSQVLKGTPYFAPYATPAKLASVGNTAKIEYAVETEQKTVPDMENPGGGNAEILTRFKSGKLSIELKRISVSNLALALGGKAMATLAGAVAGEAVTVYHGCIAPLAKPQDLTAPLTVKSDDGLTTHIEGTDYIRKNGGIIPLATGAIDDESVVKISYTAVAGHVIEGLVNLTAEYRVWLDLIDEVSGVTSAPDFYRVKFAPVKSVSWVGDDFISLTLEGELLKDDTKTGIGVSQYTNLKLGF